LQQHIKKIEKLQTKTNKKILFTEFGYRNSDQAAKNLGQKAKTINNLAQVNAYESLFQTLTQKNGLREDLPGNGMPMIITNAKKIVLITLRRKNLHLKPLKMVPII
jgi:hypothetical protein